MAREKAQDPADLSVEEKLKNLYELQKLLTEIDKIKTLRGELPLEVQPPPRQCRGSLNSLRPAPPRLGA